MVVRMPCGAVGHGALYVPRRKSTSRTIILIYLRPDIIHNHQSRCSHTFQVCR
jgi:hypothetical protein